MALAAQGHRTGHTRWTRDHRLSTSEARVIPMAAAVAIGVVLGLVLGLALFAGLLTAYLSA